MNNLFMTQMTNDRYRVLKTLYDNMATLPDKTTVIPYTQNEIGKRLNFGKHKINELLRDLTDMGLVIRPSKGRYTLTHRAVYMIRQMEELEQALPEKQEEPYRRMTIDMDMSQMTSGFMMSA